jgi:hypothetical protein
MVREILDAGFHRAAVAASVVAIALLAGCGGDDDSADQTAAGGSAPTVTGQSGGGSSPESFGEEADGADRTAGSRSVQDFLRAFADGDWSTACSLMSASTKENLEAFVEGSASESLKLSCTELIKALRKQVPANRLPPTDRIEVTGVRIEGERGFVLYRDPGGTESAFPVVREGSAWKVAAIAGQSLP